jgi:predicted MPP superfamily phosphohydrolase
MAERSEAPIAHSYHPVLEHVIDLVFRSTAAFAVVGAVAAIAGLFLDRIGVALAGLVVALGGALGAYARFVVPFRLRVTHLDGATLISPSPDAARALRVVFFSDLHLGEFKRDDWARRVVALANEQNPDLVLIGGDFAGRMGGTLQPHLFAPLRDLRAACGVFAVFGNHDYGLPGPDYSDALCSCLSALGVRVLRDECVHPAPGVRVIGLDELWRVGCDFPRIVASCDDAPANGVTFVLGHNPDAMACVHATDVADPSRTVFLFGHTHHGQIRVPFMPGAAVPIRGRLYRGLFRLEQGTVYVSAGVGENTSPARLGTTPEIVVFEVRC